MDPFSQFLGQGATAFLLGLFIWAGITFVSLWVMYTVIWLGVRRGLREFHYPGAKARDIVRVKREQNARASSSEFDS